MKKEKNKEEIIKYKKEYYHKNKEKIAKRGKEYRLENKIKIVKYLKKNKEKIAKRQKEYKLENKEKITKQVKKWRLENKIKITINNKKYKNEHKEERREYDKKNKDKINKCNKKYYHLKRKFSKKRKEYNKEYSKKYRSEHKEDINKKAKDRRRIDPVFKLKTVLRGRIIIALKGKNKSLSTMFLVGCSIDYLMYHLQEQFKEGMTWDNHGRGWGDKGMKEWHIDHIKPCSLFDLSIPEEQKKCFHYTNLQPLWAKNNFKKRDIF